MGKENDGFMMPQPMSIKKRSSSITNASVNGIIPSIDPLDEDKKAALETLGMNPGPVCCAYCGGKVTEWDHFFPLIEGGEPTGYITEIHNLVPCCSTCNSSKGNTYWRDWFYGNANNSPKNRKDVDNLDDKYKKLVNYENTYSRTVLCIKEIIGEKVWEKYIAKINMIKDMMDEAQILSNTIKKTLKEEYDILNNSKSYEVVPVVDQLVDEDKSSLETLKEAFKNMPLKFNDGWGYSPENAVKIETNNDIEIESLEYQFMERRLSMEMKKYSSKVKKEKGMSLYGFRVKKKRSQVDGGNGKTYDKITMEVTIFLKVQEQVMHFEHVEEGWFSISSSSNN